MIQKLVGKIGAHLQFTDEDNKEAIWSLFDTSTKDGAKNRNLVLDALRRKEEKE